MAAAVLAVLAVTRDRRTWLATVVVGVAANLTWLVPAVAAETADVSTDGVFAGFAARAESGAGLLPSLLSLGGIWKSSILPDARTSAVLVLLSCLLTVAAAAGLRRAVRDQPGEWRRLAALGVGALVVAAAPAVPGGAEAIEDLAGAAARARAAAGLAPVPRTARRRAGAGRRRRCDRGPGRGCGRAGKRSGPWSG